MPESGAGQRPTPESVFHPWILWLGLFWGFAEATLFFIVPDVLLTLVALFSFRRSAQLMACILVGAVAGGSVMFLFGEKNPPHAKAIVPQGPFVSPSLFSNTPRGVPHEGNLTIGRNPRNR